MSCILVYFTSLYIFCSVCLSAVWRMNVFNKPTFVVDVVVGSNLWSLWSDAKPGFWSGDLLYRVYSLTDATGAIVRRSRSRTRTCTCDTPCDYIPTLARRRSAHSRTSERATSGKIYGLKGQKYDYGRRTKRKSSRSLTTCFKVGLIRTEIKHLSLLETLINEHLQSEERK